MALATVPFIHPDDMPEVYAMTGVGTCMEPELLDGAPLAFTKRIAPRPGDVVGIIFTEAAGRRRGQPGMVKRLSAMLPPPGFAGVIVAEQINPPRRYFIPTDDVLAVHKCLGMAIRGDDGSTRVSRELLEA